MKPTCHWQRPIWQWTANQRDERNERTKRVIWGEERSHGVGPPYNTSL